MTQHTPGPWEVGDPSKGDSDLMVYCDDATGSRIADCTNEYTFHSVEEKRANARLIATAPELLTALEELAAEAFRNMRGGKGHLLDNAYAAITKARGK